MKSLKSTCYLSGSLFQRLSCQHPAATEAMPSAQLNKELGIGYKEAGNTMAKFTCVMTTSKDCNYNFCTVPAVLVTQYKLSGHTDTSYFTSGFQIRCMGRTRTITQDISESYEGDSFSSQSRNNLQ